MRYVLLHIVILLTFGLVSAQNTPPSRDWPYLDPAKDKVAGISLYRAYELLKSRTSTPVIVAVIDDGIDVTHEDLKSVLWTNPKELPGNGKDDDGNGFIDDVHGWNFMGAPNGDTYYRDQGEAAQIYSMWKEKYEQAIPEKLSGNERSEYKVYLKAKEELLQSRLDMCERLAVLSDSVRLMNAVRQIASMMHGKSYGTKVIDNLNVDSDWHGTAVKKLLLSLNPGRYKSFDELLSTLEKRISALREAAEEQLNFAFNPEYQPRQITGDNPANGSERNYGSPTIHVKPGMEAGRPITTHGTHVAGIIGAQRGNGIGMDGVADNVQLMMVCAVPSDGDERDKDVANAIRYAVANGAKVINMSFGKTMSPHKKELDEAIWFAEKNDVLICHLSHNYFTDVDVKPYYPIAKYSNGKVARNYIRVGNSTWNLNELLPAWSSNYGAATVDLFAPGTQIYSTIPQNKYALFNGTSMATPCVAGVAALLRSYFPKLTAVQVKDILRSTVYNPNFKVRLPGTDAELVPFSRLCNTGGIVNAYEAVKKALEMQKK